MATLLSSAWRNLNATALIGLAISVSCGVPETTNDIEPLGAAREALTSGYVAASVFNHSGLRHSAGGTGIPVDHTRDGKPIDSYDASHVALGTVEVNDGPDGKPIRIQTLEQVTIDGKHLFRVWAGATSNDGWIESDDVAVQTDHGPVVGSIALKDETSARAGNGESCEDHGVSLLTDATGQPVKYIVTPALVDPPADPALVWKLESSSGAWYKFSPDWDKPASPSPVPSRVFLLWSWTPTDNNGNNLSFAGGGVVRTEMRAGETFIPCKVEPIPTVLREVAAATGSKPAASAHRMTVFGAYGKFTGRTKSFYGWTILASSLNATGACKMHVRCDGVSAKCPLLPSLPSKCNF